LRGRHVLALLVVGSTLFAGTARSSAYRVVSLNLCTDQILVLLSPEQITGLTTLSRDPALSFVARQAAYLPVVRATAEAVMAVHPDLILGARFGARTTLDLLERAGERVVRVDLPTDFPGIREMIREVAALLEVPDRAAPLIAHMDATLPPPGRPVRALVWEPRGWTAGPGGLMDAVLRSAGMVNTGLGGRVSLEALLRDPPDLLVVSGSTSGVSLATEMVRNEALRDIPVRTIPTPLTICAGPFTVEAVALLAR
jgi:iron complex transport system substrate-binding protein